MLPENGVFIHDSPMNIIFFIYAFYPKELGATFSAMRLARALRSQGHSIEFIVERQGDDWLHGGTHDGFPVRSFSLSSPGKIRKIVELLRFTRFLFQKRRHFDLIHIHGGTYINIFIGMWVQWVFNKPALLKITSNGWDTPDGVRKQKYGRIGLWLFRRIKGVVSMTSGQLETCIKWKLRGTLRVIPNGVDTNIYRPLGNEERMTVRTRLGMQKDQIVLVFIGHIIERKGIDVLLQTWAALRDTYHEIALLLVGHYYDDGPDLIRSHLAKLNRPDLAVSMENIYVVGRTSRAHEYLQAGDIFVFPSLREGFGTVQIEAMACGLPCVVNNLSGINDNIFPDETVGFRIKNNNVVDYMRVIRMLIENTSLRTSVGNAARKAAVSGYSIESVADRYIDMYRTVIARGAAREHDPTIAFK